MEGGRGVLAQFGSSKASTERLIGETAAGEGSGGHVGGLVGEKRGCRAKRGKGRRKTAEDGSERGSCEELGGKLQQAKGNIYEETTAGASDAGWSAGTPSIG